MYISVPREYAVSPSSVHSSIYHTYFLLPSMVRGRRKCRHESDGKRFKAFAYIVRFWLRPSDHHYSRRCSLCSGDHRLNAFLYGTHVIHGSSVLDHILYPCITHIYVRKYTYKTRLLRTLSINPRPSFASSAVPDLETASGYPYLGADYLRSLRN